MNNAKNNHIVVISHRRSGTHLTIDAISNNFPFFEKEYLNLDHLRSEFKNPVSLEKFKQELAKGKIGRAHV